MPSYKIIILEQAISEIAESCSYYNKQVSGLGIEFEEEIFQLLEIIKGNPLLFPIKFAHIHESVVLRFPFAINYEFPENKLLFLLFFMQNVIQIKKQKRSVNKFLLTQDKTLCSLMMLTSK
ncbi:MAG: hypothetical protein IPG08_13620 [Sphingobacteriaceae bacterium]|nr:hypothetical protein [Sphingobacteriaceae bacterium]